MPKKICLNEILIILVLSLYLKKLFFKMIKFLIFYTKNKLIQMEDN
jgi:hypothetical protein